jgi:hypothetical protein
MDIKDLNRLLHKDYVTKVICKESYFKPTFNEATLISITYTPKLVTLELNIFSPIEEAYEEINIWLDQFTAITLSTDETTVYLKVEDLGRKRVLMLEFYLIPHIAKVDLRTIYDECFFQ